MPWMKGLRMDLVQNILEIDMPQSIDIQGNSAIYNFGDGTDLLTKERVFSVGSSKNRRIFWKFWEIPVENGSYLR